MADSSPLHQLEQEDPATTAKEWRIQEVGWIVLVGVVVAALAGLFGPGPLSWSSVTSADGALMVDYSRFGRDGGPTSLDIQVAPEAAFEGEIDLWLSDELLQSLEVEQITPEPASQLAVDGGVVLVFEVDAGASLEASIAGTVVAAGFSRGAIGLAGSAPLELPQVFYP